MGLNDDDELKRDIEEPLLGEEDLLPLNLPEPEPEDDMNDYYDRELREIERELENPQPSRNANYKYDLDM